MAGGKWRRSAHDLSRIRQLQSSNTGPTALEGNCAGLSANATVGVGGGVHALVGGLDRSIALQPLSVEGNTGLSLAAGVGQMRLRAA